MTQNNIHQRLFVTVGTSILGNLVDWAKAINHKHFSRIAKDWNDFKEGLAISSQVTFLKDIILDDFLQKWQRSGADNDTRNPSAIAKKCKSWTTVEQPKKSTFHNHHASAEIQSIHSIQKEKRWKNTLFELHLITTDTEPSNIAAEIIEQYFENHSGIGSIHIKKVPGLQVKNQKTFEKKGFQQLVGYLMNVQNTAKEINNEKVLLPGVLNVTGGYKGVVPVLSIVGQLLEMPLAYIYENSEELIVLDPLPMGFNWTYMELYTFFLADYKKIRQTDNSEVKAFDAKTIVDAEFQAFFQKEILGHNFMRIFSGNSYYRRTFLGDLLRQHIEKVYPIALQNFGLPIEFLYYEYFLNEPYEWEGQAYTKVTHNKKIEGRDFDFKLETADGQHYAYVEVTTFGQLFKKGGEYAFRKQLIGQIEILKERTCSAPDVYVLMLYGFKPINKWAILKNSLADVWRELKKAGIDHLDVHVTDLPIQQSAESNNKNLYSAIYQKKLTRDKAQWSSSKKEKYGNPYLLVKRNRTFPKSTHQN